MPFAISESRDKGLRVPNSKPEPKSFRDGVEAKKFYDEYRTSTDAQKAAKAAKGTGMNGLLGNTAEEQVDFGMKIFLASLKHQIPGDETNTDEMVRTLMQMTSTIQQARSNQLLEKGNAINSSIYATGLTKFEGDTVEHQGNTFTFDGTSQEMLCSFDKTAAQAVLNIFDVHTQELVRTILVDTKGELVTWDGKDNIGASAAKTDYVIRLAALNTEGKQVESKLSLNSKITSTYYDKDNLPVLRSGNIEIREIIGHKRNHQPYKAEQPRPMMRSVDTNTYESMGSRSTAVGDDEALDFSV